MSLRLPESSWLQLVSDLFGDKAMSSQTNPLTFHWAIVFVPTGNCGEKCKGTSILLQQNRRKRGREVPQKYRASWGNAFLVKENPLTISEWNDSKAY